MRSMRFLGFVTLSLLALGCAADCRPAAAQAGDGSPVELKYRLHAADSYRMRMTTIQRIKQNVQGQDIVMNMLIGMGYRMGVEAVDAKGNATVKVTYSSVVFRQEGPQGTIEFDSEKPTADVPVMAKGFAAVVGEHFTMQLAPSGQVLAVDGVDAMSARVIKKADLPEGPMREMVGKMMKDQYGDQTLKEMLEKVMRIFPDKAVRVGDTWTNQANLTKGFPLTIDSTYTLKQRLNGIATIGVHSVCKPNAKAPATEMFNMKMSYKLKGEQNGTMDVDEKTGWILRSKLTQAFEGTVAVQNPASPDPISIPMSIDGTIRVEPESTKKDTK